MKIIIKFQVIAKCCMASSASAFDSKITGFDLINIILVGQRLVSWSGLLNVNSRKKK